MAVARWRVTVGVVAGVKLALLLAVAGRWGYHRDEPYYVVGGRHPDWGYVDHPPLTPLLARGWHAAVGETLFGFRVLPALVSAGLVVVAAATARRLGGSHRATVLAALAVAVCPVLVASGHWFQTVPFDQLLGALVALVWIHLLASADVRWWVPLGALVGIGLQTKWTMLLIAAAVVIGALASPLLRRQLRGPWPWLCGTLALAIWAPNLAWQVDHGWPTLDFIRESSDNHLEEDGRASFLLEQPALLGPALLVVAIAGLAWCWRRPQWRPVGWGVGSVLLALAVLGAKSYYAGPLLPLLLAAGAIAIDEWAERSALRFRLAVGAIAVLGILALPVTLPILSPKAAADGPVLDLNDELAEELGWRQMVEQVAGVIDDLSPAEQRSVRVVTGSYGEAAAIELLGPDRGIPEGTALSAHNSYASWWPDDQPDGVVVAVRIRPEHLAPYFDTCDRDARIRNELDVDNEIAGTPISVCRGLNVEPTALRDALEHVS